MIALVVATVLTIILSVCALRKGITTLKECLAGLIIGLVFGELLDVTLGYTLGLWSYLRHPWWTVEYWTVVTPMWGLFGIGTYTLWRMLKWWTISLSMAVYETYGLVRDSWNYTVDWWIVIIGWIPLVLLTVNFTNLLVIILKRKPAYQIEELNIGN